MDGINTGNEGIESYMQGIVKTCREKYFPAPVREALKTIQLDIRKKLEFRMTQPSVSSETQESPTKKHKV